MALESVPQVSALWFQTRYAYRCHLTPFEGSPLRRKYLRGFKVPNCEDPVFRAWCSLCDIVPGQRYDWDDYRLAQLQELMQQYDPSYDPESDPADDYLNPFSR